MACAHEFAQRRLCEETHDGEHPAPSPPGVRDLRDAQPKERLLDLGEPSTPVIRRWAPGSERSSSRLEPTFPAPPWYRRSAACENVEHREQTQPAIPPEGSPAAMALALRLVEHGRRKFEAKDYHGARELLCEALAYHPEEHFAATAKYFIGETLFRSRELSAAADAFLDLNRDHPSAIEAPQALFRLGETFAALSQFDEACLTFREIPRRFPGAPEAFLARADEASANLGCDSR